MTAPLQRIGIIKPCCLGDAVMALPVIDNLKCSFPDATIEVWCGRHTRPVFEAHPAVEAIVEIPSVPSLRDIPGLIRRLHFSPVDGFFVLDRSRIIDMALRAARSRVVGTMRANDNRPAHEIDRYLSTLELANLSARIRQPSLDVSKYGTEAVSAVITTAGTNFVALHPGGAENPGTTMHSKRWQKSNWRELIEWLERRKVRVVLTGSPDELPLCETIARGTGATIAAGTLSLLESAYLASRATAFVGPDTGLSHLAAATGVPTVVIFGPTNPRQYAPRGNAVTILAPDESYDIADADLRKGTRPVLPGANRISVAEVTAALGPILDQGKQIP